MKYAVSALVGIGLLIVLAYTSAASQYVSAGRLSDAPNDTPTDTPTATLTSTPTVTNTPDPCAPVWSVVSSPNVGTDYNHLYGVAAVSANDVWAVGYYAVSSGTQTLVEHWDGNEWSVVPSPNPGLNNQLNGVAAVSANDVWAVGVCSGGTLVEHWDGSTWSVVPSPNGRNPNGTTSSSSQLNGVTAVSANDVWAVGTYYNDMLSVVQTLVEHWDGTAWSLVPSPNYGPAYPVNNYLYGIAAVSANDVWAVGDSRFAQSPYNNQLMEHWNGTQWNVVTSPNPPYTPDLYGVAAVSANDVWAVGDYPNGSTYQTLILHNGAVVSNPNVGTGDNHLYGVAALSANDVWAVGYYCCSSDGAQTLVEHWDGSSWSVVPSPNPSPYTPIQLNGVAAVSANDMWAVGSTYWTLVEHYLCTPTSTPTSTPTPIIVGHITWQGPPTQPNARQQLPITLTLKLGTSEINYPSQNTDASGFFTVSLGSLPASTYEWRVKGPKYLANLGTVSLTGDPSTQVEMGLMKAGDANNDNIVTVLDANILRRTFGLCMGDSGYDARGDFDNSNCVSVVDFNLLRANFGTGGVPPISPH